MNNDNQNEMPDYVKNLPTAVRDFVFDDVWESRTMEIAKKYSLSNSQADTLANTTLLVLIRLEHPDTFLETIITDLGISRLLAEQIMTDLETRVFEYALTQIEKSKPIVNEVKTKVPQKNIFMNMKTEIKKNEGTIVNPPYKTETVEIRPTNLPMVEKNEPVKIPPTLRDTLTQKPESKTLQNEAQPEPVQRPIPVPRFVSAPTSTPQNIIDAKLNTTVKGISEKPQETSPQKYTSDPYREPLE